MTYNIREISYEKACKIIGDMWKYQIETSITIGALLIHPSGTIEFDEMNRVCRRHDVVACYGNYFNGEAI